MAFTSHITSAMWHLLYFWVKILIWGELIRSRSNRWLERVLKNKKCWFVEIDIVFSTTYLEDQWSWLCCHRSRWADSVHQERSAQNERRWCAADTPERCDHLWCHRACSDSPPIRSPWAAHWDPLPLRPQHFLSHDTLIVCYYCYLLLLLSYDHLKETHTCSMHSRPNHLHTAGHTQVPKPHCLILRAGGNHPPAPRVQRQNVPCILYNTIYHPVMGTEGINEEDG